MRPLDKVEVIKEKCEETVKEVISLLGTYSSALGVAINFRAAILTLAFMIAGLVLAYYSLISDLIERQQQTMALIIFMAVGAVALMFLSYSLISLVTPRVPRVEAWKVRVSSGVIERLLIKRKEALEHCKSSLCLKSDEELLCHDVNELVTALSELERMRGHPPPTAKSSGQTEGGTAPDRELQDSARGL